MKYLVDLQKLFHAHSNKENAEAMKKYMKDRFEFIGIKSSDRRVLIKKYVQEHGWPLRDQVENVVVGLYSLPYREFHYTAVEMAERLLKTTKVEDIHVIEYLLEHNQWWDTVDPVAVNIAGRWLKYHREFNNTYFNRWNESEDLWLNRTAILYQLKYRSETDLKKLSSAILTHATSKEFFIRKAIGWALREYAKTEPEWVRKFVADNDLSNLSRREALKHIPNKTSETQGQKI